MSSSILYGCDKCGKDLLRLKRYGSIRPLVVKIRNKMTPQENKKVNINYINRSTT